MDERKYNQPSSWDDRIYGTGRTQPRKSHGSIIALLLILVIFLSGVVVFLSMMNVRLLSQLTDRPAANSNGIVFSRNSEADAGISPIQDDPVSGDRQLQPQFFTCTRLGICGEDVSSFYQHFYTLPQGLMITSVDPDSPGSHMGMEVGDVLISLNGQPVTGMESLGLILNALDDDTPITVTVYRAGIQLTLS